MGIQTIVQGGRFDLGRVLLHKFSLRRQVRQRQKEYVHD